MGEDDGTLDPRDGIEERLASLEARVADLMSEIAALRGPDAAMRMTPPTAPPTPITPAPPTPVTPVPPGPPTTPFPGVARGPWVTPAQPPRPAGPPPLAAGWARYVPGARPDAGPIPSAAPAIQSAAPIVDASAGSAPAGPPTRPPQADRPRITFAELEERLTGRLLAYVGGAAVLLGAVLFLSLAFTRGWIDPAGRVAIGLVGAAVVFGLGAWLFETRPQQGVVATVLVGVGLGIGTVSIVGATRLYDLVPVEEGLVGSLLLGVAAAIVAIRVDSRAVGVFGLLAVLGAPPLLGATPGPVAVALIGTTLVGTTIVALQRSWRWFPGLAFALSAPQLAIWIAGDVPVGLGIAALAAFWLVNAVAAGGEELLRPTDRLRDSSATLLMADAAFLIAGGFAVLDGPAAEWRGLFLLGVALAHAALAGACIVRQGDRHPFGLLVTATGVAALTMAVPIQFQGSAVVIAWVAEATVLAWLAAKRDHLYAGLAACVLGTLAIAHFLVVEAPMLSIGDGSTRGTPFLDPAGTTLAFMLGGLTVAAWFLRDRRIRVVLAVVGILLVTYTLPFELSGLALVGGWSILGVLAVVAERSGVVPAWPDDPAQPVTGSPGIPEPRAGLAVAGLLPMVLAVIHVALVELPFTQIGDPVRPTIPFTDQGAIGAAILVAAILVMGASAGRWGVRIGVLLAGAIVTYMLPFELSGLALVGGWSILGVLAVAAERSGVVPVWSDGPATGTPVTGPRDIPGSQAGIALAGLVPMFLAIAHVALVELRFDQVGHAIRPAIPFTDQGAAGAAILVAAILVMGASAGRWGTRIGVLLAGAIVSYALPFEVPTAWVVIGWATMAAAGYAAVRIDRPSEPLGLGAGLTLTAMGLIVVLAFLDPPDRLVLGDASIVVPFFGYVAVAALAGALGVGGWAGSLRPYRPWPLIAAGGLLVYVMSVAIVDAFASRIGGTTATEELAKQAQVAMSVAWTLVGAVTFAMALVRRVGPARQAGLALLALATAKVFLLDLASLDVAYRVLSLVGLGLLLLGSAYAYQRLRPGRAVTP